MASLLTTKEMLAALENIIKGADKYIYIFTFNIKIDPNFLSRLKNASKRGVKIVVVFGVDNGDTKLLEELLEIRNCSVYYKEYLHAKFYFNEKELLIGSMNLSEASAKNNYELGALFSNDEYKNLIQKAESEAKEILSGSVLWEHLREGITEGDLRDFEDEDDLKLPIVGRCVRCKLEIDFNPDRPLCSHCYQIWSDWENDFYPENYCHACGNKHNTISYAKPQCYNCYVFYNSTPTN